MAFVEVASTVTCDNPMGVVVPNVDGVVLPLTAPARNAKLAADSCWRGESVSKLLLSDDTPISRKRFLFVLKSRVSGVEYPLSVSPMFTLNTPLVTVTATEVGAEDGHSRVPELTVALFQIENLK